VLVDVSQPVSGAAGGQAEASAEALGLDAEKIARLTMLVKDTIGFSEVRGDSVNVISERFTESPLFTETVAEPIWEQSWLPSVVKQIAASVVVLLLIFAVLRPALKSVVTTPGKQMIMPVGFDSTKLAAVSESPQKQMPAKSEYDQNLSLAQSLVEQEPARAARMISEWVSND
jgi:flagellar M-ring protein FliF